MPARCVVSFATDAFTARAARMRQSLEAVGFDGDVMVLGPDYPDGWPAHLDVPFAFKPLAFAEARRRGADVVLWLDASCVAVQPLDVVFAAAEDRGYLLFAHAAYRVGEWAGDVALDHFGVSRDEAMAIPEVNAAAMALDLRHPRAAAFLDRWTTAAREEIVFRGRHEALRDDADYRDVKWNRRGAVSADPRVSGHRHDQTAAGLVAHALGLELTSDLLRPYRRGDTLASSTVLLVVRDSDVPLTELDALRLDVRRRSR